MEPTIVERSRLILAGFGFFGDPFAASGGWTEENEIGRLWNRFGGFLARHGDRVPWPAPGIAYELHLEHEETAARGHYEVFVGVEVAALADVPVELLVKVLPPTRYAVFTLAGAEITSDWSRTIYQEWLPASGYRQAFPYMFQRYDERFKGLDRLDESVLDVYIPISK